MHDPLTVAWTVAFEEIEDGWVMARVLEKPGAMSQGRTREEARDNVRDGYRQLTPEAIGKDALKAIPPPQPILPLPIGKLLG